MCFGELEKYTCYGGRLQKALKIAASQLSGLLQLG